MAEIVVTDEAVEAGARALGADEFATKMDDARAALEAAAPLLQVQEAVDERPTFDIPALKREMGESIAAPAPVRVDREALERALREVSLIDKPPARIGKDLADAAMAALGAAALLPGRGAGVREALGEAWDDGNATGLDGYVGPGRGAGDVDPEAEYARERVLNKLIGHMPVVVQIDREALIEALESARSRGETVLGRRFIEGWADTFADAVLTLLSPEETK